MLAEKNTLFEYLAINVSMAFFSLSILRQCYLAGWHKNMPILM